MPIDLDLEEFVAESDEEGCSFQVGLLSHSDPVGGSAQRASKDARYSTTSNSSVLPMSDSAITSDTNALRPRPRPRPAYKGALVADVMSDNRSLENPGVLCSIVASVPSLVIEASQCPVPSAKDLAIPTYSSAVTERTKISSRTSKKASVSSVILEGSSVRNSKKLPHQKKHSTISSDVIEITSDEEEHDELALIPSSSKSKSKQPLKKDAWHTRHASEISSPSEENPFSFSIQSTHTSALHSRSSLPPSDPLSSFTPVLQEVDHPPIAVLSNVFDSDIGFGSARSSSPPIGVRSRKRKKRGVLESCVDDGFDDEIQIGTNRAVDSAGLIPAAFFASSNGDTVKETTSISSETVRNVNESKVKSASKAKGKRKAADDEDWDENGEPQMKRKTKRKNQKISRTKKSKVPPDSTTPVVQESLNPLNDSTRDVENGPEAGISPNTLTSVQLTRGDETEDVRQHENLKRSDTTETSIKKKSQEETTGGNGSNRDEEIVMKENILPDQDSVRTPANTKSNGLPSLLSSRTKSTPMSELIRKANSLPGSPFALSRSRTSTAYSPYAKSARSALSRIAPLHPNRRTPPPPLPRPPPPKKTKKQLDLEEKWEQELSESIEGWACLTDEEREALRRAKRAREECWD